MKLVLFDDFRLGLLKGDCVVDVSEVVKDIPHLVPQDLMAGLISSFGSYRALLEKAIAEGSGLPLSAIRIRPPLPKPGCIDCMAVNYIENGARDEPAPLNAFQKSPSAIVGNWDPCFPPLTTTTPGVF